MEEELGGWLYFFLYAKSNYDYSYHFFSRAFLHLLFVCALKLLFTICTAASLTAEDDR
jgi:hypothetical protein